MGLLNLTLAQLLAALIPLTGFLVALYFWDRSRRRITVATLRFWPDLPAPPVTRRHKKLQQPLSLLLQILAMLLLLLAIADWRWGLTDGAVRHHVLILDASSATATQAANGAAVLDSGKRAAERFLDALPSGDRVLLIRAAGLAEAATDFTDDRALVREAVRETESGWTALDLDGALDLAVQSLRLTLDAQDRGLDATPGVGEIVLVGGERAAKSETPDSGGAPLRWIATPQPEADLAVRRFSAARAVDDPTRWEVGLELWNDSASPTDAKIEFYFENRKLGERSVRAEPAQPAALDFRIRTEQAGTLEARLPDGDASPRNDRATLELPAVVRQALVAESDRTAALARLFEAAPSLSVVAEGTPGALTVADRASSPTRSRVLFLDARAAPIQTVQRVRYARVTSWFGAHPLGQGLRSADVTLNRAAVFRPEEGDVVIASVEAGPVIVARDRPGERWVAFGFDLLEEELANRLTAPLLFANAVRWFAPDVFRQAEFRAESPGTVELDVAPATREQIEVETLSGAAPVWVYDDGRVRLFAPRPSTSRLRTPYRNAMLALSLPEVAAESWTPPGDMLRGIPPAGSGGLGAIPLWPMLALAALAILVFDWLRFGRGTEASPAPTTETLRVTPEEKTAGAAR